MSTNFFKTSAALGAGMVLAASALVAPGAVGAPIADLAAAWGENGNGELGNGKDQGFGVPVAVDTSGVLAAKALTAISAGEWSTCVVADGKAYCWGGNTGSTLGDLTPTTSSVPVPVDTSGVLAGVTVTAVSAGYEHSCVVADGKVYCWGHNGAGQLGDNSTTDSPLPVAVSMSGVLEGKTVTAISAGEEHTCVVADGKAYCWGAGFNGQLGNGSNWPSSVPVAVRTGGGLGTKTITAISAGGDHSCAIAEGRAYCWGRNHHGQLGNDGSIDSNVPVRVAGVMAGRKVTAISAGWWHTCAVAGGKAYCWGDSSRRGLDSGTTTGSKVPVAIDTSGVLAGKTLTAISAANAHTCAVASGKAYCWGNNWAGQLGNKSTKYSSVPVTVNNGGVLAGRTITAISTGGRHSVVLTAPGAVTEVTAVNKNGQVAITWRPVAGATSYRVRMSKPGGKKYARWETTVKRLFKAKVKQGKQYRFQVAAIAASGRGPATTIRFKGR